MGGLFFSVKICRCNCWTQTPSICFHQVCIVKKERKKKKNSSQLVRSFLSSLRAKAFSCFFPSSVRKFGESAGVWLVDIDGAGGRWRDGKRMNLNTSTVGLERQGETIQATEGQFSGAVFRVWIWAAAAAHVNGKKTRWYQER